MGFKFNPFTSNFDLVTDLDAFSGTQPIVSGNDFVDVVFPSPLPTSDYKLIVSVRNETDADPIFLNPIITAQSTTGFSVTFNAPADSSNYELNWQNVSGGSVPVSSSIGIKSFGITIDGGGSPIATGIRGDLTIPYSCTITGWTLLGDQTGSIVVDVWKVPYASYPATVANTITGSEKPTISASNKGQDLALSTWTTAVTAGDTVRFNVDSCSTITRVNLMIQATVT